MEITPILIAGNKRSGSSNLRRILNFHPEIYIMPESDVFWILYLFHNKLPLTPYEGDSPSGYNKTMEKFGHLLNIENTPYENYLKISSEYMKLDGVSNKKVIYIGDQKPYQHTDSRIVEFVIDNFPKPKYIHLVRHPYNVVLSSSHFNGDGGTIWKDKSSETLIHEWSKFEFKALAYENHKALDYFFIKYEDILFKKEKLMKLFYFLNLSLDDYTYNEITKNNVKNIKFRQRFELDDTIRNLMNKYSYEEKNYILENRILARVLNYYYYLEKKIKNPTSVISINSSKY